MIDESYIRKLISDHAKISFDACAQHLLQELSIIVCHTEEIPASAKGLFIPDNLVFSVDCDFETWDCFGVDFSSPSPILNKLSGQWSRNELFPWLLVEKGGDLVSLDFDFLGFVGHFLVGLDQKDGDKVDVHGRQNYEANTLVRLGLQGVPILNIALFAILSVAKGWKNSCIAVDPSCHVLPPRLVLSHDCDQLRGNDIYTQSIRLFRFFRDAVSLKFSAFRHLKFLALNFVKPTKYYFKDALYMKALEERRGFKSVFYLLNGRGGRFGARSGGSLIGEFVRKLDGNSEVGIHYNYQYSQNLALLEAQLTELNSYVGHGLVGGRAHYLAFDRKMSFKNIQHCGIRLDESVGFSSHSAFRVGYAGAYILEKESESSKALYELPLLFMDSNVIDPLEKSVVISMLSKVEAVGGVVTFLFHPGLGSNPEFKEFMGEYENYLSYFSENKYRSLLPRDLVELLDE